MLFEFEMSWVSWVGREAWSIIRSASSSDIKESENMTSYCKQLALHKSRIGEGAYLWKGEQIIVYTEHGLTR
jgi:hypothetical protein